MRGWRNVWLGFFLLMASVAFGQDPQFSQYYQSPLYLNPGFTGVTPQQRLTFNHRLQWPNLPQAFSTFAASYDIWVNELSSGFGILATTDKMGSAGWRTTNVNLLYSYKLQLNKNWMFSPGLAFGYGINGLDRSKLTMGDGLEYNNQSLDPDLNRLGNQQYFDFSAGFIVYSSIYWFGLAVNHLNEPNMSILNDVTRLPMKVTVHGGARIPLTGGLRTSARVSYLTPSFIYQSQGGITQFNFGLNYHIDPVFIGLWYRGKPWEESVIGSVNHDALVLQLGMYLDKLTVGYSYDFNISPIATASGGAHEISLMYEFSSKPISRGVKKRNRLIPCPTGGRNPGFWGK
ncbi:MAG: type IX secretion system membrane protein PorP/SprF [Cyclobacteriaceae bacterium]|nr:type IX secretion system membrane protein PorP/SprF [Cyclobacteriaceae bacterium]